MPGPRKLTPPFPDINPLPVYVPSHPLPVRLICPSTRLPLRPATPSEAASLGFTSGYVRDPDASGHPAAFYPVVNDIAHLLPESAIPLTTPQSAPTASPAPTKPA